MSQSQDGMEVLDLFSTLITTLDARPTTAFKVLAATNVATFSEPKTRSRSIRSAIIQLAARSTTLEVSHGRLANGTAKDDFIRR